MAKPKTNTERTDHLRARNEELGMKRHEVRIADQPEAIKELSKAVVKINKKYLK